MVLQAVPLTGWKKLHHQMYSITYYSKIFINQTYRNFQQNKQKTLTTSTQVGTYLI